MTEEQVLSFAAGSIRSIWALELLLILRKGRDRAWSTEELIRESRSSLTAVGEGLNLLKRAGMIAPCGELHQYAPADHELEELAGEIETLYSVRPTTVIKAILTAPQDKLRIFSDAFKFRE